MNVVGTINIELDNGKYVVAVYLDIKKTFDTVDHGRLLEILAPMGLRGPVNNLIRDNLDRRIIKTYVN